MYQNLMNAEFVFVESLTAENLTLHVIRIIHALTKVSRQVPGCFCCTYMCRQLHLLRNTENGMNRVFCPPVRIGLLS